MNIDFSAQPLLSWYVVLLLISGIAMVGIGVVNNSGLSGGWRAFNVIAGLGFTGYAIYLGFFFDPVHGSYFIFFKAFILPVAMVFNFFRSLANRSKATAPPAYPPAPAFQAPAPQPYPGQAAQPQAQPYGAAPAAPAGQQPQAPHAG